MTDHPITPPPELVRQWLENSPKDDGLGIAGYIATQATRWGADQELEACCEWLQDPDLNVDTYKLRAARRPKPPSLKEQALKILEEEPEPDDMKELIVFDTAQVEIIRRALKQLDA